MQSIQHHMSTSELHIERVLDLMRDPDVSHIVLFGVCGIGKTWTVRQAASRAIEALFFEITIWVSLSINDNLSDVRNKIIYKLSIAVDDDDNNYDDVHDEGEERSRKAIHSFLLERKFLLIFDDMWSVEEDVLDLIGIPRPNQSTGSKVVVTTRSMRVKYVIQSNVLVQLRPLRKAESLELFRQCTGRSIAGNIDAETVVGQCYGLPLAIILIASVWHIGYGLTDAPEQASSELGYKGPIRMVYHAAKLAYSVLPNETVKQCCLYCLLLPNHISISELVRYWVLEGFFDGYDYLEEANDMGRHLLMELIERGLFYRVDADHVSMHDIVREVTMDIVREGSMFSERMSFLSKKEVLKLLSAAPTRWNKLTTLLLKGNRFFKTIPEDFFHHMKELRVLDLSCCTGIEQLPSSMSDLHELRVLLLSGCEALREVSHIQGLENLEVLDLSGASTLMRIGDEHFFRRMLCLRVLNLSETPIEWLPSLTNLSDLRHLLLSGCRCLKMELHLEELVNLELLDLSGMKLPEFPHGISKLTRLKRLRLASTKHTSVAWENLEWLPEGLSWYHCTGYDMTIEPLSDGGAYISVSNPTFFKSLHKDSRLWENCFSRFHFCLSSPEDWATDSDIHFQSKQFPLRDTYYKTRHFSHSVNHSRYLEVHGSTSYPRGIEGVLNHAELVSLCNVVFMERLSDICLENMRAMTECWIQRCERMKCVFDGEEEVHLIAAIGRLESLWISNLSRLRWVATGGMEDVMNFGCLKHLHIDCCPKLTEVFASTICLESLETLQVRFCERLERLLPVSALGENVLPRLHTLQLWELPGLECICGGVLLSLKTLKVKGCPGLKKLPYCVNVESPLLVIKGERLWWNNLMWEDERIRSQIIFRKWGRF